jgi:hypothetical protein
MGFKKSYYNHNLNAIYSNNNNKNKAYLKNLTEMQIEFLQFSSFFSNLSFDES